MKKNKIVDVGNIPFSNDLDIKIILGPCQIESRNHAMETCSEINEICEKLNLKYVYKSSYDKANRSSHTSARGIGIDKGIDIIVDIDWQGTRQFQKHIPNDIVKVFILPPSIKELENRLGNRASEDKKNFLKRMSEARKEISHYLEYDFVIINKEINLAVNQIKSILISERLRRYRHLNLENIVEKLK